MAIGDEVDYYLECVSCGDRSDFEQGGVVPNAFYDQHRNHPDDIKIVKRTKTTMPSSINLREIDDSNDALDVLMSRHPDWAVDYTLEARYSGGNYVTVVINAQNAKGTFALTGKARQDELAGLLEDMESKMLRALTRDSVRADEWRVKRDFLDVTTFGSDEQQRVVANTEYSAFVEYGKAPGGTPPIKKGKLFDSDSILGQAVQKAADVLRADITRGTLFGTGAMLDSIKLDEEKKAAKAEGERLRTGNWDGDSYVDAVDALRYQLLSMAPGERPSPDKITRKDFDRLDAQSKMNYIKGGGQVFDVLPPDVPGLWSDENSVVLKKGARAVNAKKYAADINAKITARADEARLKENIRRAEEKAKKQKLDEAIKLLKSNGIAVENTIALNSNGNTAPSAQGSRTTPEFDDTQNKPRRRIRLAKS